MNDTVSEDMKLDEALTEFEGYDKHGGTDDTLTAARLLARAARAYLASTKPPLAGDVTEWRCFHCDEVFTDEFRARLHFGGRGGLDDRVPACLIKGSDGGLLEALRRAEQDAADAWFSIHNESTDAAKAYHAQSARHQEQLRAVEQVGYDRGIADAKAHPETLGLSALASPPIPGRGEPPLFSKEAIEDYQFLAQMQVGIRDCIGLDREKLTIAKRLRSQGYVTIADSAQGPMIELTEAGAIKALERFAASRPKEDTQQ